MCTYNTVYAFICYIYKNTSAILAILEIYLYVLYLCLLFMYEVKEKKIIKSQIAFGTYRIFICHVEIHMYKTVR